MQYHCCIVYKQKGILFMKRIAALLLTLSICVSVCACKRSTSKSVEAQKADELILAIGNVTEDSEQAIMAAQIYYDVLNDKQKAEVENYHILEKAIADFDEIKEKKIEYETIYSAAKDYEAKNLLDDAYAEYKKLPVDYKNVSQRITLLQPYVGLAGEWHCDNETAVASDGSVFTPGFVMGWIEISSIEYDSVKLKYNLAWIDQPKSIFRNAPDLLYSVASGHLDGPIVLEADGTIILGKAHGFTANYGSMDITFKLRPDNKLQIEYLRTLHTYNAAGETYFQNKVIFTYSKTK